MSHDLRTCRVCRNTYPLSEEYFYTTKNGFKLDCKKCCNLYTLQWRAKLRERKLAQKGAYIRKLI